MTDPLPFPQWAEHYERHFREQRALFERLTPPGETSLYRAFRRFARALLAATLENAEGRGPAMPSGRPAAVCVSPFLGEKKPMPTYADLSRQPALFLADYLYRNPDIDLVVELGAGNGRNLFDLAFQGLSPKLKFIAAEQSAAGRGLIERQIAIEPGIPVAVARFDFGEPDLSWLPRANHVLFFTAWTTMFVHHLGTGPFLAMIESAPRVTGFHFEPCGFQIPPLARSDFAPKLEAMGKNWNLDLVDSLETLDRAGALDLFYVGKDNMPSYDEGQPLSVLCWRSPADAA